MASSRMKIQMKFKIEGDFIDIVTKGTWAATCCLRHLTRWLELDACLTDIGAIDGGQQIVDLSRP